MINPEDEIVADLRPSCTKEEAVAKLLGWMQGTIRPRYIQITEQGIPADQLPHLQNLETSLEELLLEQRAAVREDLLKAAEADAADDVLEAKENAVTQCDELIRKAASYMHDIGDEIAKGEISRLRVDQSATVETGVVHITLKSLDAWAKAEYEISILDPSTPVSSGSPEQKTAPNSDDTDPNGGLSRVKAEHLYATLAFFVEDFSTKAPGYRLPDGRPNVAAIAKRVSELATTANGKQPLQGQKAEAIKDRIEKALRIRREKLPVR